MFSYLSMQVNIKLKDFCIEYWIFLNLLIGFQCWNGIWILEIDCQIDGLLNIYALILY